MVESVTGSAAKAYLQKVGPGKPDAPNRAGTAQGSSPVNATDSVSLSQAAQQLPESLKTEPPFDIEAVSRIKEAIAEGKYPIDMDRITESLFESYRDLVI